MEYNDIFDGPSIDFCKSINCKIQEQISSFFGKLSLPNIYLYLIFPIQILILVTFKIFCMQIKVRIIFQFTAYNFIDFVLTFIDELHRNKCIEIECIETSKHR